MAINATQGPNAKQAPPNLYNPSFGASGPGAQSYQLLSPYGLYSKDNYRKLVGRVPRASSLSWLKQLGNITRRKTHNLVYSYFEEGQWMSLAWVADTTAVASSFDMDVSSEWRPIKTMLISNVDGQIAYVSDVVVVANTATVTYTGGTLPDDGITSGDYVIFYSNAQSEDSTAPDGFSPQVTEERNFIQTFRRSARVTDLESASQLWFEVDGQPYLFVKTAVDLADSFEMDHELAFLIGDYLDTTTGTPHTGVDSWSPFAGVGGAGDSISSTVENNGYSVFTTKGLIPTIKDRGTTVTGVKADLQDFAGISELFTELVLQIDQNYGPSSYLIGCGLNVYNLINQFSIQFAAQGFGGGMVDFSPVGGKEQAISMNLQWLNFSGYQFFFQQWPILSHKDSLGAPGMPYRGYMIGIPLGKVKNPNVHHN